MLSPYTNKPMTDEAIRPPALLDAAWDTDVEDALFGLWHDITDHTYFRLTVDLVEACQDPETKTPLTLTALKAWVERCKTPPTDEDDYATAPHHTRSITPAH